MTIKLSKKWNSTTGIVPMDTSSVDAMKVIKSNAGTFQLYYGRRFKCKIKDIIDDMLPSNCIITLAWSTYFHYMRLARMLMKNEHVLPLTNLEPDHQGKKLFESTYVDTCVI